MKKYVKPELFYEQFELNQHIADCHWEYTQSQGSCSAQGDVEDGLGAYAMFTNDLGSCNVTPDVFQDFCYTNGAGGTRTLNS